MRVRWVIERASAASPPLLSGLTVSEIKRVWSSGSAAEAAAPGRSPIGQGKGYAVGVSGVRLELGGSKDVRHAAFEQLLYMPFEHWCADAEYYPY